MSPRRQNDQIFRDIQFEEMRRQIQQLQETVNAQQALLRKKLSRKQQSSSFRNPFHTQTTPPPAINKLQTPSFMPHSTTIDTTTNSPRSKYYLQCCTCKGYGHVVTDCPNLRVFNSEDEAYELFEEDTPAVYDESEEEDDPAVYDEEFEEEIAPTIYGEETIPTDHGEELVVRLGLHTTTALEEIERMEKEEEEEKEKREIQNTDASNIFSISNSFSVVQEFRKPVDIIPRTPLFIQPDFGTPLQWDQENKDHFKLFPGEPSHNQALSNKVLISRLDSFEEGEYDATENMAIIFSMIDLRRGYTHIRPGVECKTAFRTQDDMPFGLANASSTFIRFMHQELRPFIKTKVKYVKLVFDPGGFKIKHITYMGKESTHPRGRVFSHPGSMKQELPIS